jgi:hypothetical protein
MVPKIGLQPPPTMDKENDGAAFAPRRIHRTAGNLCVGGVLPIGPAAWVPIQPGNTIHRDSWGGADALAGSPVA